jgi:hypothetical protein
LAYAFATPGDTQEVPARIVSAFELGTPLLTVASALLALLGGLAAAQAGVALPQGVWGLVIAAACAALAVRVFALGQRLGAFADVVTRPWWRRHGFWLVAIACALYLPRLGMSSLWDPWETHYGEVAREMLSRDDWISTWWANEGFFYSKPALDMWLQALAMAALGVHYQPDKMLIGDGTAPTMHPEWVVRAPVVLLSIFAVYILYKGVAQSCGRRAAMLGPTCHSSERWWHAWV